jgi:dephospho-CoA kinase
MENKIVIGLTGQIACGKGVIKKYLMENYGASDYRFSTILRDLLKRLHLESTRENLQNISSVMRHNFGEDSLAHAMAEDIKNDTKPFLVIDGIRRLSDIKFLRAIPEFKLIRIVANEKLRYERVVSRNENSGDDQKTFADFLKDQQQEAEVQIPEVMATADYEIVNEDTLDNLKQEIDKIVADIKKHQA